MCLTSHGFRFTQKSGKGANQVVFRQQNRFKTAYLKTQVKFYIHANLFASWMPQLLRLGGGDELPCDNAPSLQVMGSIAWTIFRKFCNICIVPKFLQLTHHQKIVLNPKSLSLKVKKLLNDKLFGLRSIFQCRVNCRNFGTMHKCGSV